MQRIIWWIAFILGLVSSGLLILFLTTEWGEIDYLLLLAIFILGSVILAWKWKLISSIALIGLSFLFIILSGEIMQSFMAVALFYFLGIFPPLILAGILFIVSWFLYRRKKKRHMETEINQILPPNR